MSLPPSVKTVTISFAELKDRDADISAKIEEGFGPGGLGILSITEVPGYSSLRRNLLKLSPRLAKLPEEVKEELQDPSSRYNFGWSHDSWQGATRVWKTCDAEVNINLITSTSRREFHDLLKGSFYANPIHDVPTTDESLIKRYPSYCGSNIWPVNALPELEMAFKTLGKLILDVGLLLAYHCDRYVSSGSMLSENQGLENILNRSRCLKGRLLYYFPSQEREEDEDSMSSWCGWHTDHGSLTGLTSGMFTRDNNEVPCPDAAAGLYIKTRAGQIVRVVYGEDDIAYQIGETTEILSSGYLCATPHCVRAPKGEKALGLERSTFALFMQPDWDEKLYFPAQTKKLSELVLPEETLTFGEYTERLLDKYYYVKKS